MASPANRGIIVIGGSAGATAPLKTILAALPPDLPAAVFVVLHIPAQSTGLLSMVASGAGRLPVRQVEDGMPIERGHVYLAAPGHHLMIDGPCLRLGRGPRENMARPAIDPLFRSAAVSHGPHVIGLVLSGMLSDGSAGLEAIKRCGGLALVQDPADAAAPEMPRSALDAACVDLSLPAARLGDVLSDLARQPAGERVPIPPDIRLEVDIAAGARIDSRILRSLADPAALTCPACGGVMSEVRGSRPLRFRCQVGHALTADVFASEQENAVDEAMRVALRVIEERAELVERMAREGEASGRGAVSGMYRDRAAEYRAHADIIRRAVLLTMENQGPRPAEDADDR